MNESIKECEELDDYAAVMSDETRNDFPLRNTLRKVLIQASNAENSASESNSTDL